MQENRRFSAGFCLGLVVAGLSVTSVQAQGNAPAGASQPALGRPGASSDPDTVLPTAP
jgi:hypothetical protein